MRLKRFYKKDTNIVVGVEILSISKDGKQKFTPRLIAKGMQEGWLKNTGEHILLNELKFKILAVPGRYHVPTGTKLPDDTFGELARTYIAEHLDGKGSYICNNYYDCQLEK